MITIKNSTKPPDNIMFLPLRLFACVQSLESVDHMLSIPPHTTTYPQHDHVDLTGGDSRSLPGTLIP